MFIKNRKPPLPLLAINALISRLHPSHPKLPELRQQAARYQKGYNGERKLDYHLRSLPKTFSVLSDVTLTIFRKQFQIDTLIITAHAIFIIDVKSFNGVVTFDTILQQCTQENGEKLQGRKYPITQAEANQFHLLQWLQQHQLSGMPIYYFVAFSESSTIIQVKGNDDIIRKTIIYVDQAPLQLMKSEKKISQSLPANGRLKNQIIQKIMRDCIDFNKNILQQFNIPHSDILSGVRCPSCNTLGMARSRYRWGCKKCGTFSRGAHLPALIEYSLIYGPEISNRECREFLHISRRTVYNLLKGAGLTVNKPTRTWYLDREKLRKSKMSAPS